MKKILLFLILVIIICITFFSITNIIDKSIKKIPDNAVLL